MLGDADIEGFGWGLGLAAVVDSEATMTRDGDFWWSGYYGTTFFVSPEAGIVLTQNQPGPYSDLPYPVYLAQAFGLFGS